jgi:cytochrome b involved in lipid metabolism
MYIKYLLSAVGIGIVIAALFLLIAPAPEKNLSDGTVSTTTESVSTSTPDVTETTTATATTAVAGSKPAPMPTAVPVVNPVAVQPSVPQPAPEPESQGIRASEVATHATKESCWSIIDGSVYDLTSFITKHPGGASKILAICGKDGTESFTDQHGGERKPESILAGLKVGELVQ